MLALVVVALALLAGAAALALVAAHRSSGFWDGESIVATSQTGGFWDGDRAPTLQ
jgi:hypothetical protein